MRCAGSEQAFPGHGVRSKGRGAAASPLARRSLALGFALSACTTHAFAATAGTVVSNTASLSFEVDGVGQTVSSNTVSIIVAEKLDVTVVADVPTALATEAGENAVGFRVANRGNGAEVFTVVAGATGEGASIVQVAADADDNGIYDPAIDRQLSTQQLPLDPGQQIRVFVIVGGVRSQTPVSLSAAALTGTGAVGTLFQGRGQRGGDAVVGQSGAAATAQTLLTVAAQDASLIKSQTIAAPDGSARAMRGAIITYSLEARFAAPARGAEIDDAIPVGTAYVAGSMMLDGARLSDGADADAGHFDAARSAGGAITVSLGDTPAGVRTFRFQVTVQ